MQFWRKSAVVAGLLLIAFSCVVMSTVGCNSQKNQPPQSLLVRDMAIGDYKFDYEMVQPSSIETKGKSVVITSGPQRIEVLDGKLNVDNRSFGEVHANDAISVLKGEVKVNGEIRKPGS